MSLVDSLILRTVMGAIEREVVVEVGDVTIFVGPNNSGKSLALKELMAVLHRNDRTDRALMKTIRLHPVPSPDEVWRIVQPLLISAQQLIYGLQHTYRTADFRTELSYVLDQFNPGLAKNEAQFVLGVLGQLTSVQLDGETRLKLADAGSWFDLQSQPHGPIQLLFKEDVLRKQLSDLVYEAFQKYLVLDPTGMSNIRPRLSDVQPPDSTVERSWLESAVHFQQSAQLLSEMSDGTRAYVGILLAAINPGARFLLIDEPEAFLHPPLARLLGHQLSDLARERGAHVFAATHSSHFLAGCLQSGAKISVVGLRYEKDIQVGITSGARALPPELLSRFTQTPLLRTTGVVEALFYRAAVVTEAATDRAFYDEINRRLVENKTGGHDSCLYLNAQNKQTECEIAGPLREAGVPTAMIVDLDVIKDGGATFQKLCKAAGMPEGVRQTLGDLRGRVLKRFEVAGTKDTMNTSGLAGLAGDGLKECKHFIDRMADFGVFVVDVGEVERWLRHLEAEGFKNEWLPNIFSKMGSDPKAPGYVIPGDGDAWEFLRKVNRWLTDPNRQGVPS